MTRIFVTGALAGCAICCAAWALWGFMSWYEVLTISINSPFLYQELSRTKGQVFVATFLGLALLLSLISLRQEAKDK